VQADLVKWKTSKIVASDQRSVARKNSSTRPG
jgi:hypothetical protein